MWRNVCLLSAVCAFSVSAALADVVNVTVSGTASGGASVGAKCFTSPDCIDMENLLLFSGTNDNSDNFSASGSETASARITLSGMAQQITTTSPSSLSADLETSFGVDAIGAEWGADVFLGNSYLLSFTLTADSLVQLSDQLTGDLYLKGTCLLEGQSLTSSISIPCSAGSFDQSLILASGSYDLSLTALSGASIGPSGFESKYGESNQLMLTADFAAIPEPRSDSVLPIALLGVIAALASTSKRA